MRLYLIQHGEAAAKEVDPARPLTARGTADSERLGDRLAAAGITAGRVLHSGKLRAEQTARRLAERIGGGAPEASDLLAPNAEPGAFDWQLDAWDTDTLVVGHQPFLGRLVGHLVCADPERTVVRYEPSSAVCLERDDAGAWAVAWMLRPELLG